MIAIKMIIIVINVINFAKNVIVIIQLFLFIIQA